MGVHYSNLVKSLSPFGFWRNGTGGSLVDVVAGLNMPLTGTYSTGEAGGVSYDPATSVRYTRSGNGGANYGTWYPFAPYTSYPYTPYPQTWVAWVNLASYTAGEYYSIVGYGYYNGSAPMLLRVNDSGRFSFLNYNDGTSITITGAIDLTSGSNRNTWHFVGVSSSSEGAILYENGVAAGSTAMYKSANYSVWHQLSIGAQYDSLETSPLFCWDGWIQDVAGFPAVLTPTQHAALYNAGRQKFIDLNRQSETA
jgi:hypothetical protein